MPLALGGDDVDIWCRETELLDPTALMQAEASLSVEERARCDRFRFAHDRRDYVVAHDLLRRSLSKWHAVQPAEWQFEAGAHGQPIVRSSGPVPSFSLSHTRGFVACAIASGMPIGLDTERVDRSIPVDQLAERHFTPREVAALRRCPDSARLTLFVELWSLKEAFAKAVGLGLRLALDTVSFELDEGGAIGFTPPPAIDASTWHFALFAPSDSTRVAVAVCCGTGQGPQFTARLSAADGSDIRYAGSIATT